MIRISNMPLLSVLNNSIFIIIDSYIMKNNVNSKLSPFVVVFVVVAFVVVVCFVVVAFVVVVDFVVVVGFVVVDFVVVVVVVVVVDSEMSFK